MKKSKSAGSKKGCLKTLSNLSSGDTKQSGLRIHINIGAFSSVVVQDVLLELPKTRGIESYH